MKNCSHNFLLLVAYRFHLALRWSCDWRMFVKSIAHCRARGIGRIMTFWWCGHYTQDTSQLAEAWGPSIYSHNPIHRGFAGEIVGLQSIGIYLLSPIQCWTRLVLSHLQSYLRLYLRRRGPKRSRGSFPPKRVLQASRKGSIGAFLFKTRSLAVWAMRQFTKSHIIQYKR